MNFFTPALGDDLKDAINQVSSAHLKGLKVEYIAFPTAPVRLVDAMHDWQVNHGYKPIRQDADGAFLADKDGNHVWLVATPDIKPHIGYVVSDRNTLIGIDQGIRTQSCEFSLVTQSWGTKVDAFVHYRHSSSGAEIRITHRIKPL